MPERGKKHRPQLLLLPPTLCQFQNTTRTLRNFPGGVAISRNFPLSPISQQQPFPELLKAALLAADFKQSVPAPWSRTAVLPTGVIFYLDPMPLVMSMYSSRGSQESFAHLKSSNTTKVREILTTCTAGRSSLRANSKFKFLEVYSKCAGNIEMISLDEYHSGTLRQSLHAVS